ncbi:methyltransferase domain-containing protein [Shewanella sp. JM162201]|uniref:tRNA 5-carboxymethoxyuridine methyltransferase n=1 Tax=Shewanella jiangmenensis TaxID=2837387 RepID=A0ABS5V2X3_9GAMM|nr:methyltransferase domain-containing protein [Shewanella jiangmenensis]MBT1444167.1 methyltransferase domain-containing protein [Shewanella jiangmenensis]
MQDKNFDKLAGKFAKNIYGTLKGDIRAAVLWRDLQEVLPTDGRSLRVLDAGGGFGFFSQKLAALGHSVVLCDLSAEMLAEAQRQIDANPMKLDIQCVHSAIQDLSRDDLGEFDLILCHAVVEWLADAHGTMTGLLKLLKRDGLFSLMFYNQDAMCFHSLVAGNFGYVNSGFKAKRVKLSPNFPLTVPEVEAWCDGWQMDILCRSGVRVIHDYLKKGSLSTEYSDEGLIEMELKYSREDAFLRLGRYVHFIARRKD